MESLWDVTPSWDKRVKNSSILSYTTINNVHNFNDNTFQLQQNSSKKSSTHLWALIRCVNTTLITLPHVVNVLVIIPTVLIQFVADVGWVATEATIVNTWSCHKANSFSHWHSLFTEIPANHCCKTRERGVVFCFVVLCRVVLCCVVLCCILFYFIYESFDLFHHYFSFLI